METPTTPVANPVKVLEKKSGTPTTPRNPKNPWGPRDVKTDQTLDGNKPHALVETLGGSKGTWATVSAPAAPAAPVAPFAPVASGKITLKKKLKGNDDVGKPDSK